MRSVVERTNKRQALVRMNVIFFKRKKNQDTKEGEGKVMKEESVCVLPFFQILTRNVITLAVNTSETNEANHFICNSFEKKLKYYNCEKYKYRNL